VKPEGLDLVWVFFYARELFRGMVRGDFESGEVSITYLMAMLDRGDTSLVGIPVFSTRAFRHGHVFVHPDAGINVPGDLVGKRVGMPEYIMATAVWVRAFLQHDYGLVPEAMEWIQGGVDIPGYHPSEFASEMSKGIPRIKLSTLPTDTTLVQLFKDRELDVLMGPEPPKGLSEKEGTIRRLFPNHRALEKEYYRRTGHFPITHLIVVRRDVYERHRWIPSSLVAAFSRAKELGWKEMSEYQSAYLPWMPDYVAELQEVFGGPPYQDGFEQNYQTLEAITSYGFEQGVSRRKIAPEELFARETLQV
ncbi:MAG: hypothetical protein AAB037_04415, partial [Chloroflexota bacterium]